MCVCARARGGNPRMALPQSSRNRGKLLRKRELRDSDSACAFPSGREGALHPLTSQEDSTGSQGSGVDPWQERCPALPPDLGFPAGLAPQRETPSPRPAAFSPHALTHSPVPRCSRLGAPKSAVQVPCPWTSACRGRSAPGRG